MSTRERLVEATMELLWERGYEATSPQAILERSGAGKGSLYYHFRSKAELTAAVLEKVAGEMQGMYDPVLHSSQPPLERVRAYLRLPREGLRGCRLGRMAQETSITQDTSLRAPIAAYFTDLEGKLAEALRQAQQEGALDEHVDATDLAVTLTAVVQGGYVLARALQDQSQMDRAISGALALLDANERKGHDA